MAEKIDVDLDIRVTGYRRGTATAMVKRLERTFAAEGLGPNMRVRIERDDKTGEQRVRATTAVCVIRSKPVDFAQKVRRRLARDIERDGVLVDMYMQTNEVSPWYPIDLPKKKKKPRPRAR